MSDNASDPLSTEHLRLRTEDIRHAQHSAEMEGGHVPDEVQADQWRWARGEISGEELTRRTRAHVEARLNRRRDRTLER